MNELATQGNKPHDGSTDIEQRDARALTECMTVLPKGGDIYEVVSHSGNSYRVDGIEGRCTCPDYQYRDDVELCKHSRRVRFATGQWAIPPWANMDAVDPLLGEHVEDGPRQVASDGGVTVPDSESEGSDTDGDTDDTDGRPDNCDCGDWNSGLDLPCFPCYRDGYETPATE